MSKWTLGSSYVSTMAFALLGALACADASKAPTAVALRDSSGVSQLASTGTLSLQIAAPPGAVGSVVVAGPSQRNVHYVQSATVRNLVPGTYTVTAFGVTSRAGQMFTGSPGSQSVTIQGGRTASATVTYSAAPAAPVVDAISGRPWAWSSPISNPDWLGYLQVNYATYPAIPLTARGRNLKGVTAVYLPTPLRTYVGRVLSTTNESVVFLLEAQRNALGFFDTTPGPMKDVPVTFEGPTGRTWKSISIIPSFYADNLTFGQCTWYTLIASRLDGRNIEGYRGAVPISADPSSPNFPAAKMAIATINGANGVPFNVGTPGEGRHIAYVWRVEPLPTTKVGDESRRPYRLYFTDANWDKMGSVRPKSVRDPAPTITFTVIERKGSFSFDPAAPPRFSAAFPITHVKR